MGMDGHELPPAGAISDGLHEVAPFVWTKTADAILDSWARFCQRISGTGH